MSENRPRYFKNDGTLLSFDPQLSIPEHLATLVTRFPPVPTSFQHSDEELGGIFSGRTSIAALFYYLREDLPPVIKGRGIRDWAKAYQEVALVLAEQKPKDMDGLTVSSRSCGIFVQPLGWALISAWAFKDVKYLEPILATSSTILDNANPLDEWICGRAGYLYILRLAKSICPELEPRIKALIQSTIHAMLARSPDSDDPWYFVNHRYVGLGHGWFGIIAQILLSDPSVQRAEQCRPWLVDLIHLQGPDGFWPLWIDDRSSKEDNHQPKLVEVGHGPPGIVICLLAVRPIYERYGDKEMLDKMDRAVELSQDCIWLGGNLTKESCLCNGAAGNSLALTDMRRKGTFLALGTQDMIDALYSEESIETSSNPSGLLRGLAGRIWAMAEYKRSRSGVLPTFNDV